MMQYTSCGKDTREAVRQFLDRIETFFGFAAINGIVIIGIEETDIAHKYLIHWDWIRDK
jgi:hypothetical protein